MYLPASTYRIQLNGNYTFNKLGRIVGYLHSLGISTIYSAPITKSSKGSTHGYDVCDPSLVNGEIGTEEDLGELSLKLKKHHMGWLQDIVPNHMAFLCNNPRIFDVLERGPLSPYYHYFDVDWNHPDPIFTGKVMVPFLGEDLDAAIDNDSIQFVFDDSGFHFRYGGIDYPVSIETLHFLDFKKVPDFTGSLEQWEEQKRAWLEPLLNDRKHILSQVTDINQDKSKLKDLLNRQHYVLSWYKLTDSEINFRRFFTINHLICLSMEKDFVFKDYHAFLHELYSKGMMQGLRIDHIDGLYNPQEYIHRLREEFGEDCYMIVEKILEYDESLDSSWDLQGTSGYEFLSFTNQLLTCRKGSKQLLSFYKKLVPSMKSYEEVVFDKKLKFLHAYMGGELDNLVRLLEELQIFDSKTMLHDNLQKALGILMASFPVYRIYPDHYPLSDDSLHIVDKTFEEAFKHPSGLSRELTLLKEIFYAKGLELSDDKKLTFLRRLMQFTGQLAAKGVEDTTFYNYNPLISHNEVGDSPSNLGVTIKQFHEKMIRRKKGNPYSLNATATHDTKRGEDARMRINAIAEYAEEWILLIKKWTEENKKFKAPVTGLLCPSVNEEYFIYQSLLGSFPIDQVVSGNYLERTHQFIQKVLREEKEATTHENPNLEYEEHCFKFIASILDPKHSFLKTFIPFLNKVNQLAWIYSLEQVILKITAPGIPDIYQGCELWDLSYVDPDNRRHVDYDYRARILEEIQTKGKHEVIDFIKSHQTEGFEKFFITHKALTYRRKHSDLFLEGEYIPLMFNENLVAFARNYRSEWVLVLLPINIQTLLKTHGTLLGKEAWNDLSLQLPKEAPTQWKNLFTDQTLQSPDGQLPLSDVFASFEVAILHSLKH